MIAREKELYVEWVMPVEPDDTLEPLIMKTLDQLHLNSLLLSTVRNYIILFHHISSLGSISETLQQTFRTSKRDYLGPQISQHE